MFRRSKINPIKIKKDQKEINKIKEEIENLTKEIQVFTDAELKTLTVEEVSLLPVVDKKKDITKIVKELNEKKKELATKKKDLLTDSEKEEANRGIIRRVMEIQNSLSEGHLRWVFWVIILLNLLCFIFGIALIIISIVITFQKDFSVDIKDWISGIIGVVFEVIAFLLYYPIDRIERSSANHSQHLMLMRTWLISNDLLILGMNTNDSKSVEKTVLNINKSTENYVDLIGKQVEIDPESTLGNILKHIRKEAPPETEETQSDSSSTDDSSSEI